MTRAVEPYATVPRRLRRLVEDGDLAPTAYAILHYVVESGGDRPEGFATSYGALASTFRVSAKTAKRSLLRLRELRAIAYDVRQGQRSPFRIRLDETALVDGLGTRLRTGETEVVSEVASDTAAPPIERDPAPGAASTRDTTSDTSRARAETEPEKRTPPNPPQGGTATTSDRKAARRALRGEALVRRRRRLAASRSCDPRDHRRAARALDRPPSRSRLARSQLRRRPARNDPATERSAGERTTSGIRRSCEPGSLSPRVARDDAGRARRGERTLTSRRLSYEQREALRRLVDHATRAKLAHAAREFAPRRRSAEDFLREALMGGARPGVDVVDEAKKRGIGVRSLRHAKRQVGVEQRFDPSLRRWTWRLPEDA